MLETTALAIAVLLAAVVILLWLFMRQASIHAEQIVSAIDRAYLEIKHSNRTHGEFTGE